MSAKRMVSVAPERLERWLAGFAARHGTASAEVGEESVTLQAADGSVAVCQVPFPPLTRALHDPYGGLIAHALAERTVGVLLVRRGGFAAGVFRGARLEASKTGSRHVQGRSAAGGWSQQRFARRREAQARGAYAAAADTAAAVLLPAVADLDAVVLGGDRAAVATVLEDRRLAPLRSLVSGPVIDVAEPRRAVLDATPQIFRAVRIQVHEPDQESA